MTCYTRCNYDLPHAQRRPHEHSRLVAHGQLRVQWDDFARVAVNTAAGAQVVVEGSDVGPARYKHKNRAVSSGVAYAFDYAEEEV